MTPSGNPDLGEYEVDLRHCIWRECKGDLVELDAYASFNWVTISYKCINCGREFTMKIET